MTGAADSFATLTFTYDSGGNEITAATSGPGTGQPSVTLTSGYNAQHSLTSVTDNLTSVGLTTLLYDAGQRLTTITTSFGGTAGPQIVTSYAPNNQISSQSRTIAGSGTQVNTTYMYDAADRQTTITDYVVRAAAALATYVYSYDKANRVTTMVDAEGTYTYTYDNANELTNVDKGGTQVESYAYDSNGNRTGTGYSTTVMNETLTSPGVTYTYDHAGNMISANSGGTITTYTYDYHNRLTEVDAGRHGHRDVRLQRPGPADRHPRQRRKPDVDGLQRHQRRRLAVRRFQQLGHAADPVRLWAGHGERGGCRRASRPDELGRDDGVVSSRQAGFGPGHRELVGVCAGPHRLRQLRQHHDRDERKQWRSVQVRGDGVRLDHSAVLRQCPELRSVRRKLRDSGPNSVRGGDANTYGYVHNSPTDRTDPTGLFDDPPLPMPPIPSKTLPFAEPRTLDTNVQQARCTHRVEEDTVKNKSMLMTPRAQPRMY